MTIHRLPIWGLAAWTVAVVVVAALVVAAQVHLRALHAQGDELLALEHRVESFIGASQELLQRGTDESGLREFRNDALAIRTDLQQLLPADLKRQGDEQLDALIQLVSNARSASALGAPQIVPGGRPSQTSADVVTAADQGVATSRALSETLHRTLLVHHDTLTRDTLQIGATLIGLALVFALASILAFLSIHRRVSRPARALSDTLDQPQQADARAEEKSRQIKEINAELQANRDRLLRAQRVGGIGSWEVTYPEEEVHWSDPALELLERERDDSIDRIEDFMNLVHPDDRERLRAEREQWLTRGGEFVSSYRIVRDSGEIVWLSARAQLTRADDGSVLHSTGTLQDVTKLREQQKWLLILERLLEGSEDFCGIVDESDRYQWVNSAYGRAYGHTPEEMVGRSVGEIVGGSYFDREILPQIERCRAGESPRFETQRTLPGKGIRNLLVRYYPVTFPDESGLCVAFVITDVTDFRKAESRMTEQAELLQMAGRAAHFGGWSVNLNTGRITWSEMTAEIHALPPDHSPTIEEAIAFYAPEHRTRIRDTFQRLAHQGGSFEDVAEIIDANGERVWVQVIGEAARDENGNIAEVRGAFQDITESKKLELDRQKLADQLQELLERMTDGYVTFDRQWRITYINPEGLRMWDATEDDVRGAVLWELIPQIVGLPVEQTLSRAMRDRSPAEAEQHDPELDATFDLRIYPFDDGLAVFFRDVKAQKQMLDRLRKQEAGLRESRDTLQAALNDRQALINALPAHIAMLDSEGTILDVNEQWRHYGRAHGNADSNFGVGSNYVAVCGAETAEDDAPNEEIAEGLRAVLRGDIESFEKEYPCHSPEQQQWFRAVFNRLESVGSSTGAVAMHIDVTERELAAMELERTAFQDPLTGILSRVGFERELRRKLNEGGWEDEGVVLTFDVMRLREVNEVHGYPVGDRVLTELGERLVQQVGDEGLAGRLAGDEFAAYIRCGAADSPHDMVHRIEQSLFQPFEFDNTNIEIKSKMGFTVLGQRRRAVADLLREAEIALFETSESAQWESQRGQFTSELEQRSQERIQLTGEMPRALLADEFQLHYQPKVDLIDGRVIAAEALLRWQHPERGLLPPGAFIPIAEQNQFIGPLGRWALRAACKHLRQWSDEGADLVRVSVNVSLVQFLVSDFPAEVEQALRDFDVPVDALSLEITESVFEGHSDFLRSEMVKLRELGVRLSLDDFGTGYSSLQYLQHYPFNEIKVDRAFTDAILDDKYSREILLSVLHIAETLDADVVAEGVETLDIVEALLELGCRIGQGYYYSIPLEAEDFFWLLRTRSTLPLRGDAPDDLNFSTQG